MILIKNLKLTVNQLNIDYTKPDIGSPHLLIRKRKGI